MALPFASLRDDFTDNLIADCWTTAVTGSATVQETSAQARITLPSNTAGSHQGYYRTVSTYDLTSDSFYVTIGTMVATGVAATAFFDLFADFNNYIRWTQTSNTLKAQSIIGGVTTDRYSATWSGTTYKYLRIRADTTTVYWDSSTNGTSWTNRASLAISSLFAVTALYAQFGASCGNIASPGSFRLDDVNLILPALTTNWRWTQARWPLINRHRTITLALDTAGTAQAYLVTADDIDASGNPSGSVRYWSGPADGGRELTEQTTQVAAEAMAVNIPTDGRFDLPAQIDGRVFRLYHRSIDGAAYTIREFFPRRLIQADDVDAEMIRGLTIAGHQFICDELSALSADVGTLTAGIIDGVTIYAGAGREVTLDSGGITIIGPVFSYGLSNASPVTVPRANIIEWTETTAAQPAGVTGSDSGQLLLLGDRITLAVPISTTDSFGLDIRLNGAHRMTCDTFTLDAGGTTSPTALTVQTNVVTPGSVTVHGGLNVGTGSGAATGQIVTSNDIFVIDSGGDPRVVLGDSTSGGNFGYIQWNSASDEIRIGTSTGGDTITITESQAWTGSISFSNSWVDYGVGDEVGYRKDALGIVHLRGMMKSGTINTTAWTLPSGFRPTKRHIQAAASNGAYGTLTINTDGTVVPTNGSNVYFSFNGVSFPIA